MGRPHPFWVIFVLASCRPATREPPPPSNHDAAPRARTPARDPLGLAQGTQWHFHGSVTRADDSGGTFTQPLAWTTSVAAVEDEGGRVVYTVIGWPGDAPDMPARTTTIVVEGGVVHLSADGDTSPATAWFALPLSEGGKQCDDDGIYCWTVERAESGFDLWLRTGPDATVYRIESGRGVTRYEYHHNGTTDDVVLERDP